MLDNYIKWFKAHERILAAVIILAVIAFLGNKYLDKSYDSAVARQQATQQVLQDQASKNADLQKQQDAREQQYQQLVSGLQKQNASLVSAVAARNQVVAGQQKTDAGLPGVELAARHQALLGVSTGVASTDAGFLISSPAELQTVQALETLPVLQANLKDEQQLSANKDQQITSITTVVSGLNDQVAGLKLQITDGQTACDARVDTAKKSRWKWFKAGAAAGFVAGVLTGHYL